MVFHLRPDNLTCTVYGLSVSFLLQPHIDTHVGHELICLYSLTAFYPTTYWEKKSAKHVGYK